MHFTPSSKESKLMTLHCQLYFIPTFSFHTTKRFLSFPPARWIRKILTAEMSLPGSKPTQSEPQVATDAAVAATLQQHFQGSVAPNSSSWNNNNRLSNNTNLFSPHKRSKLEESDEDLFTVPDVEAATSVHGGGAGSNIANNKQSSNNIVAEPQFQTGCPAKRRRGRNPVDKEYRRLKRLLRNRVSAQQARERKKVYVNDLEARARELQDKNSKLEERISTLINENTMLRKVLMNTRPKPDESAEPKQDQSSKS